MAIANLMTSWEFLLQKQGDKSWLPLESLTLEILEGSYRLASRSSCSQELVNINLRYLPGPESSHKALQFKTSKQVSPDGLLLIMPYTEFTPGIWQINCDQGTLAKTLQFEVLSVMVEGSSTDWLDFQEDSVPERILPKHLINLKQIQYLVTGQQDITIAGEAYVGGEIEIILKNPQNLCTLVSSRHAVQGDSDRLVFSYAITIPHQSESQVAIGEVRLHPNVPLNLEEYVTYQSIMVTCEVDKLLDQAIALPEITTGSVESLIEPDPEIPAIESLQSKAAEPEPLRMFPLLPFEPIPPHATPIRRNIKLPELPKFLVFGKKARNLPPWSSVKNLSTLAQNYYEPEDELHYEFEEESTTISKPASNVIHLSKSRPK
jgi:hypothetical protein